MTHTGSVYMFFVCLFRVVLSICFQDLRRIIERTAILKKIAKEAVNPQEDKGGKGRLKRWE